MGQGSIGVPDVRRLGAGAVDFDDLEFFADTPWYCHQPFLKPMDFTMDEDELYRQTEEIVRASPGFRPYADFHRDLEQRVPRELPGAE